MDDTIYTVAEVAAFFRVSVDDVLRWIAGGDINAIRINRTPWVSQSEINACLKRWEE
jgi:excisionase family DNA binding protein